MRKEIASGNYLRITNFSTNGLSEVVVEMRDDGEDEVTCFVEDGILYVYKDTDAHYDLVLATNFFRLVFRDRT